MFMKLGWTPPDDNNDDDDLIKILASMIPCLTWTCSGLLMM